MSTDASAKQLYERARELHETGVDEQQAVQMYRRIVREHPDTPEAEYAETYLQQLGYDAPRRSEASKQGGDEAGGTGSSPSVQSKGQTGGSPGAPASSRQQRQPAPSGGDVPAEATEAMADLSADYMQMPGGIIGFFKRLGGEDREARIQDRLDELDRRGQRILSVDNHDFGLMRRLMWGLVAVCTLGFWTVDSKYLFVTEPEAEPTGGGGDSRYDVDYLKLPGGLIGGLKRVFGDSRSEMIRDKLAEMRRDDQRLVSILQDDLNLVDNLARGIMLSVTFGLWTKGDGYLLITEKT